MNCEVKGRTLPVNQKKIAFRCLGKGKGADEFEHVKGKMTRSSKIHPPKKWGVVLRPKVVPKDRLRDLKKGFENDAIVVKVVRDDAKSRLK